MPRTLLPERREAGASVETVTLSALREKEFCDFLYNEISRARTEREQFDDKLIRWERQYEAIPEQDIKNFPWRGASNIIAPLTAIAVEALESRIDSAVLGEPKIWYAKPTTKDPVWNKIAVSLERYLNHASRDPEDLDTERALRDLIPDCILNGLSFLKIPYVYSEEEIPEFNASRTKITYQKAVTHNGPKHLWVSSMDMLWPSGTFDIQKSLWLAQRFYLEWYQIVDRIDNPTFGYSKTKCEKIRSFLTRNVPKDRQSIMTVLGFSGEGMETGEFYEIYIRHPLEEKDVYRDYIATFHPESRTLVKLIRHFYAHRRRPYVPFFYSKRRKTVVAQGVGSMLERLQEGVSTSINQMVDNATAANTIVLKVKKGTMKATEEIYPMKKLMVDETTDVEQFRIGESVQGISNSIAIMRDFAERRVSVTDYMLGMQNPDVGTRATAAGTLGVIQEGQKQISRRVALFKQSMDEVGRMTVQTYQQFAPQRKIVSLLGDDAADVAMVFDFPPDWIFDKVKLGVELAAGAASRQIERQQATTLFNTLMGYYAQIVQLAQPYASGMIPPVAKAAIDKSLAALNELLEKILLATDIFDTENFMLNLAELEASLPPQMPQMPMQGGGNGMGSVGGGVQSPQGVLPQPGMGGAEGMGPEA